MLPSSLLTKVSALSSILNQLPDQRSFNSLGTIQHMEQSKNAIGNAFQDAKHAIEKVDIKAMVDKMDPEDVPPGGEKTKNWFNEDSKAAAGLCISVAVVVAPALLTGPALAAVGFGAQGVVANSMAAVVHSNIGNVASGSAFSVLQSAGAGGAGLATVNNVVQGGAAVVGSAIKATAWLSESFKKKKDGEDSGGRQGKT